MNPDYLLTLPLAQQLYHQCAAQLPIIDYHNHLSPAQLRENRPFENITRLWIASDPYTHRALRILGVEERYITGDASDKEKFRVWYENLPRLIRLKLLHSLRGRRSGRYRPQRTPPVDN